MTKACLTCNNWIEQIKPSWDCFDDDPTKKVGECAAAEAHGDRTNPMMAAVCDSDGTYGLLITAYDFCCILWLERNDNDNQR